MDKFGNNLINSCQQGEDCLGSTEPFQQSSPFWLLNYYE